MRMSIKSTPFIFSFLKMLAIKLVHLAIFPTLILSKLVALNTTDNLYQLQRCINQIHGKYDITQGFISYINCNKNYSMLQLGQLPVMIENKLDGLKYFEAFKSNFYVIAPAEDLQETFFKLTHSHNWNPRAKFVIVLNLLKEELFEIARKYYVFNIVVLIQTAEFIEIYSYLPYKGLVLANKCVGDGVFDSSKDLFPNKLPGTWENTTVRTLLYIYPPYVFSSNGRTVGMEMDALKLVRVLALLVQSVLKFKVVYVKKAFKDWGRRLNNGSYEGAYSYFRNYEVDLGLGFFYANHSEIWDFDETYPYMEDNIKWAVPMAKPKQHWLRVMGIFTIEVWILIFAFFCFIAGLSFLVGLGRQEAAGYGRLGDCFMKCYQIFLGQAAVLPKTGVLRTLIGLWVFFGLLITATFQGRLIAVLNFNVREDQISNVEQLIASKIAFGLYGDTAVMFREPTNKNDWYIYNNYRECPAGSYCLNRVAFNRDFATFKPKKLIEYMISTAYLDDDGNSLVYMFDANVFSLFVTMIFAKGFPMYDEVNLILSWLRSAGFVDYIYKKAAFHAEKAIRSAQKASFVFQVITMESVFWIFWFLLLGLSIASVVFIGEVCLNQWRKVKIEKRWIP